MVREGTQVVEGQEVAIVEAMKMQNVLRAPRFGTVKTVNVQPGSSVVADEVLMEFVDEAKKAA
jgi:propionyl-CoA carboxylase alpha chain